MGASLPTLIKACFNAMETSQFTLIKRFKVMPSDGKVMLTLHVLGSSGSTASPFSVAW
jgi:hypothetical protein